MKVTLILIFVSISLATETAAQSRVYVSDADGTSFDQLVQVMLSHNKDLQAARESLRQAEARLTQSRLKPNPSLDVTNATDALFSNEGDSAYSVTLSQPFELGGKRAKRSRVAETMIEVSRAEIADVERRLSGKLRSVFTDALGAAARLDLFRQLDQLNQQTVSTMNVRLRAGDASQLDSRLLQAQTNQIRTQALVAENELDGLFIQLRTIAGLAPDEPLTLKPSSPDAMEIRATEQTLVAQALKSRPDIVAARLREDLAEQGIDLAKSEVVPNATASVRYGRESVVARLAGPGQSRTFDRENVVEFGVSLPIPIFNREQGAIAEAASRRVQARAERESLEQTIAQDVQVAFRRYQTLKNSLDLLRTGVVGENQQSFRIVQLAYDLGELRFLDIVNQQRLVIDAENSYVSMQTDLNRALADLELAVGGRITP